MAAQRTTFDKLQRERRKKAKAAAKREKRQGRAQEAPAPEAPRDDQKLSSTRNLDRLSAPQILERIEEVHHRHAAGLLTDEEFEEQKSTLFERLSQLPQ